MENIKYKEIAELLNKKEGTIKNWKRSHPVLLELVRIGAFCRKNNISIEQLEKCVEFQELTTKAEKEAIN